MQAKGETTARLLVEAYLGRIDAIDGQGPELRAVIEKNPDALSVADQLDAERRAKGPRGPLHGIPVLIKDNIATADRMQTTAGSLALAGAKPPHDAYVVERLHKAGAVILGKSNLSEWANFRSTRSTSGWSSRGGQCKNPYAPERSPCGSSSGSAVGTAANLCAAAVGTETNGSIICPSSACGIVGLKPTVGLVSRTGIVPIAHTQDTAGPMARTVTDAALLLGVLAGVDPRDEATQAAAGKIPDDYAEGLDAGALKGARIGVARSLTGFHDQVDALLEQALGAMREAGAVLVDPIDLALSPELMAVELDLLLYEFKADIDAYLRWLGPSAPVKTLAELIAFNEGHRAEVMPWFGQELLEQAAHKGPLSEPGYAKAIDTLHRATRRDGIDRVLRQHRLDAIAAPSGGPAWMLDPLSGDHFLGGSAAFPAIAGYPHVTVPAGRIRGLPVGLSLFSTAFAEPKLLALAYAFERATGHRQPPKFLP
ncbi:MAG: amidase [Deltaproteobacteria bacterium]|jgi:amidase|nr:amidase [Deltaproteobacteria bacterium]MBW2534163.1 amidase [Deltaproteobacteria bacterium]